MRRARPDRGSPDGAVRLRPLHARASSPWAARLSALVVATIVTMVGLVAVAAVRDTDAGGPTLAPVTAVPSARGEVAPPTSMPAVTPESLTVTAPAEPEALVADATEVVLVGDSLAQGAAPALAAILDAAGVALRVDARSGRGTAEGALALADLAVQPGAIVVVILGTNDADDRTEAFGNVRAVVGSVPEGTPVKWIDVARTDVTVFNEVVNAVAAIDPDVEVFEWSAVVQDNPGLLVADGIHFTAEGYSTLAAFIATEVLGLTLASS